MADGYKVVLELVDEYYPKDVESHTLDICSYSFEKDINERSGNVESKAHGGVVHLGVISKPPQSILRWAMKYKKYRGRIMVISPLSESHIPDEEIKFENAFCVNLKFKYNRYGASHYNTFFTISAGKISVGQTAVWIDNRWTNL